MADARLTITAEDLASRKIDGVKRKVLELAAAVAAADEAMDRSLSRSQFGRWFQVIGALAPLAAAGVNALTAAVGGLGSALVSVGPGLAILGAGVMSSIQRISTTEQTLKRLGAAVQSATTPKAAKAAQAKLEAFKKSALQGPFGKEFGAFEDLKTGFQGLSNNTQLIKAMTAAFQVALLVLTKLKPLLSVFASLMSYALSQITTYLNSPAFDKFLNWAKTVGALNFTYLLNTLGHLWQIVVNLSYAFTGTGEGILKWIQDATGKFAAFTATLGKNQAFNDFLAGVRENAPLLMGILGKLIVVLAHLVDGVANLGITTLALKSLYGALDLLSKLNPKVLGALFVAFETFNIVGTLIRVGQSLAPIVRSTIAFGRALFGLAKAETAVAVSQAAINATSGGGKMTTAGTIAGLRGSGSPLAGGAAVGGAQQAEKGLIGKGLGIVATALGVGTAGAVVATLAAAGGVIALMVAQHNDRNKAPMTFHAAANGVLVPGGGGSAANGNINGRFPERGVSAADLAQERQNALAFTDALAKTVPAVDGYNNRVKALAATFMNWAREHPEHAFQMLSQWEKQNGVDAKFLEAVYPGLIGKMHDAKMAAELWRVEMQHAHPVLAAVEKGTSGFTNQAAKLDSQLSQVAKKSPAEAWREMKKVADATGMSMKDMTKLLPKTGQAVMDTASQVKHFNDVLHTTTATLNVNKHGIDGNTSAAKRNRAAIHDAVMAFDAMTPAAKDAAGGNAKLRDELIHVAEKAGLSKDAARKYIATLIDAGKKSTNLKDISKAVWNAINALKAHPLVEGRWGINGSSNGVTFRELANFSASAHASPHGSQMTPPSKHARGGHINGPGSGTSDSIPAWLSNGEFVLKAAAVKKYGLGLLNSMNDMHYAGGGLVTDFGKITSGIKDQLGNAKSSTWNLGAHVGHFLQAIMQKAINAINASANAMFFAPAGGHVSANVAAEERYAFSLFPRYGWGTSQRSPLVALWMRESGWSPTADNPHSSAYGIPQALPGSKMAAAGADWRTNPATQIRWGLGYIKSVYGSPGGAWAHEVANNWYDQGGVFPNNSIGINRSGKPEVVFTDQQWKVLEKLVERGVSLDERTIAKAISKAMHRMEIVLRDADRQGRRAYLQIGREL